MLRFKSQIQTSTRLWSTVESMKVEWTSVGRWSLFDVDEFAQKAIASSTVPAGLGISAKFPSLAVLISMGSLMAFGGRIVCNTLPALVIALGIALLIVVIGLRFILSAVYFSIQLHVDDRSAEGDVEDGNGRPGSLPSLAPV
ncbi:hypothetical protein GGX14DRAFT_391249 [Mycena pura]|uniref:Uncharacterized protein n=1 Tax=Mycena pura TaxID=153505 RepID=A0AAD6VLA4_9AGAR|nr:hypothetical protein GGX14DRAFT_391249 [Mycena pura]